MQKRRNDNQTEITLYCNGHAYSAGLSGLVCVWENIPVLKDKRKRRSDKFAGSCFHHAR
jgi:hypothetical protein